MSTTTVHPGVPELSTPKLVIEGDEYNTAFFDRGAKFLHYRPHLFLVGPVEFDHGDLYPNLEAVLTAFRAGTAQVPRTGAVIVEGKDGRITVPYGDTARLGGIEFSVVEQPDIALVRERRRARMIPHRCAGP